MGNEKELKMPKSFNQKLKLIYILKYLENKSDENNPLSVKDIISYLEGKGISAERKSIYDDIETLISAGFDIVADKRGRSSGYFLASREFETAELKLLVDAVQSSKFLSVKKSMELIKKLETLTSENIAKTLSREVYVSGRVKTMVESIYYNIDAVHGAIAENKRITFNYFNFDVNKEKVLRREGKLYEISPFALIFEDEYYYMFGFDSEDKIFKNYRVDKMMKITLTDKKREGEEEFKAQNIGETAKMVFGMYRGREEKVTLRFSKTLVGAIIDRFGKDVVISKKGKDFFEIKASVMVSPQFFGWLASFGAEAEIISPIEVKEEYITHLKNIIEK